MDGNGQQELVFAVSEPSVHADLGSIHKVAPVKPRMADSAESLWAAILAASRHGVVVAGRGIHYPALRIYGEPDDFQISPDGAVQVLVQGGCGLCPATEEEAEAVRQAVNDDCVQVVVLSRPGYGSEYRPPVVIEELHNPSGHGFAQPQVAGIPTARPHAPPEKPEPRRTILPGDVFATLTGRHTTPFPKYSTNPGKAQATKDERKLRQWLKDNAIVEAKARGDGFNLLQWEQLDVKNWSPCDGDLTNLYLFGDVDGRIANRRVSPG